MYAAGGYCQKGHICRIEDRQLLLPLGRGREQDSQEAHRRMTYRVTQTQALSGAGPAPCGQCKAGCKSGNWITQHQRRFYAAAPRYLWRCKALLQLQALWYLQPNTWWYTRQKEHCSASSVQCMWMQHQRARRSEA